MSGNLSVSNNLSVAGSTTTTNLTASNATIPNLTVSNLTVSGTTNTGTFSNLVVNSLTGNSIVANNTITSPQINVGTKNVGTTLATLESNMTTAQTNITTLLTRTTNQSYAPTTQTTTILGTVATPALTLNGVDLNTRIGTSELKLTNQTFSGSTTTFTGTVAGISTAMVGLGNVDNTSDANKPVSTAQQTALNLKSNIANPTFTGTVTCPTITLNGVNLNTRITSSETNITALQNKTSNVDNTSDANKPVSTATQTALNLKANIANPTFTGTVTCPSITLNGTDLNTRLTSNETYANSLGGLTAANNWTNRNDFTRIVVNSNNATSVDGRGSIEGRQGTHLQWNRTSVGDGQTYIMNHKGAAAGNGGFKFQRYNGSGVFMDEPMTVGDKVQLNCNMDLNAQSTLNAPNIHCNTKLNVSRFETSNVDSTIVAQANIRSGLAYFIASPGTYCGVYMFDGLQTGERKSKGLFPVLCSMKDNFDCDDMWIVAAGYKAIFYSLPNYSNQIAIMDNTGGNSTTGGWLVKTSIELYNGQNDVGSVKVFYREMEIVFPWFS